MSKFRPSNNNLYVIPDIHGNLQLLDLCLKRILPLRFNKNVQDYLVFLGDYIDRHSDSHLVLDRLIELKKQYPHQIVFIKGNHEDMFLRSMNAVPGKTLTLQDQTSASQMWFRNGGYETTLGYLQRVKFTESNPLAISNHRIKELIPSEHFDFLQNHLQNFWIYENYVFVHGGCDPNEELNKQESEVLWWDRSLIKSVKYHINAQTPVSWNKIIVTGHNVTDGKPIIHSNFLMLDCGSPKQLLLTELRSMQAFMAIADNQRLVKYELQITQPSPYALKHGVIKRINTNFDS